MSAKPLSAGALRHRITIERPNNVQDEETGAIVTGWIVIASNVPSAVEPVSGRDYIAAAQAKSAITARITLRYRPNLNAAMRVRHDATVYDIKAILPDPNSGKEWLTLLVESHD